MRALREGTPDMCQNDQAKDRASGDEVSLQGNRLSVGIMIQRTSRLRDCFENRFACGSRGNEILILDEICRLHPEKSESPHVVSYF